MLCEASEQWTATEAEAFLKLAGTSPDYPGLYRSVREFRAPEAATLAALTNSLPEAVPMPGLVQAMVAIDGHTEHLRACQKAGWRTPPAHPDVSPAHEAVQLWEQFRELQRLGDAKNKLADFAELLAGSERAADELMRQLRAAAAQPAEASAKLNDTFRRITGTRAACHKEHRN